MKTQKINLIVLCLLIFSNVGYSQAEKSKSVIDGVAAIIADNIIQNKKYVPILSAIPVIGYFFKTTSVQKEQRELLMFITPTIYD